jgi:uncharacterized protein YcfJ
MLAALFAVGCAGQKLGRNALEAVYYDNCYEPIEALREDARQLDRSVIGGALIGAFAGAMAGALGSGRAEDIVVGTIFGAIAGAGINYLLTKSLQNREMEERFAMYEEFLDFDMTSLDAAVTAARVSVNCYQESYVKLDSDYQKGLVSKAEMVEMLEEIKAGTQEAALILKAFNDEAAERIETYAQITLKEAVREKDKAPADKMDSLQKEVKKMAAKKDESEELLVMIHDHSEALNDALENILTA